ncbi:MAG: hypothetical protein AVDCRST_MAG06-2169, partial [uncultured Nocardioides sp.]
DRRAHRAGRPRRAACTGRPPPGGARGPRPRRL